MNAEQKAKVHAELDRLLTAAEKDGKAFDMIDLSLGICEVREDNEDGPMTIEVYTQYTSEIIEYTNGELDVEERTKREEILVDSVTKNIEETEIQ